MASQVQPFTEGAQRGPSATSLDEYNFETLFQVPPTHSLVQIRTRSRGGSVRGIFWDHDEYDPAGQLIARYSSFDEVSATGLRQSGWRKFDREGLLVAEGTLET
jgi:hypothetical protein